MENFNIVNLIEKNSITRLTKTYKNKLVNKLKTNFTDNEQQLFLASFYCYLNYDSKKDFIIDFDTVWKWTGFSRKDNAKRLLEKYFTKDIDYEVFLQTEENSIEGGRPKENILLTVNTFKKFCLKANTCKADEIHDYYIKLEDILQETIDEQTNELRNQLNKKNKELKKAEEKLSSKEEENKILKKQVYKRQRYKYTEGSSVYIIMNDEIKYKFKFGESKNIENRLTQLNSASPTPYYVHKLWYTRIAKKTERIVHDIFGKFRISNDCEWFESKVLLKVIDFVDKLVSLYEEYDTIKVIKKEEIVETVELVFIDNRPKQCNGCLLYKNVSDFFIRDHELEEPKEFSSDEEKENFFKRKYRSQCKECNKKTNDEREKLLRLNPTAGRKECRECKELLNEKLFFEDFNECIDCYKKINNINEYCKQCNKCKKVLFSKDFHSDCNKADNLHTICKQCRSENMLGKRKLEDFMCQFCNKPIKGEHNLKSHQKTIGCLKNQGFDVKRKKNIFNSKKIQQINIETKEIIKKFDSIADASRELNISSQNISKVLRGENKSAGNFIFKYL